MCRKSYDEICDLDGSVIILLINEMDEILNVYKKGRVSLFNERQKYIIQNAWNYNSGYCNKIPDRYSLMDFWLTIYMATYLDSICELQ